MQILNYFSIVNLWSDSEHSFPDERMGSRMSAVDELIKYILSLTPEQVNKVVSQIPRLTELLEEPSQPCPQEQTSQTQ